MGADRAAAHVYQYGPPPAMVALISAAKIYQEENLWRVYMAEISWIPAAFLTKKNNSPERFPDLLQDIRGNTYEDNRTEDEIKSDLVRALRRKRKPLSNEAVVQRVNDMIATFTKERREPDDTV